MMKKVQNSLIPNCIRNRRRVIVLHLKQTWTIEKLGEKADQHFMKERKKNGSRKREGETDTSCLISVGARQGWKLFPGKGVVFTDGFDLYNPSYSKKHWRFISSLLRSDQEWPNKGNLLLQLTVCLYCHCVDQEWPT